MNAVITAAKSVLVQPQRHALLGVADAGLARMLERGLERSSNGGHAILVSRLAGLREQLGNQIPA